MSISCSLYKKVNFYRRVFSNDSMRHPDITNTTSTTTMSITATIRVMTPEQTAEAIKNVAKNIRETSYKMQTAVRDIS
ncbi:MAG TPA: hypothetical protein VE573_05260 [Nitrososphaeraceae archaeon]|nr:hypothetical protein [Nitrososphaeraceae archaeon]